MTGQSNTPPRQPRRPRAAAAAAPITSGTSRSNLLVRYLTALVAGLLESLQDLLSPESWGQVTRREAASFTVAALAIGYVITPVAFYLGATGVIFFQNLLLIWVGSVVALMVRGIVGTTTDGKRHFTWKSTLILALPSVWLVGLLLDLQFPLLSFVDLGMGLISLPYILWVMFRAAVPEAVRVRSKRLVVGFMLILAVVASCAFGLGKNHHRFLYCEDFTISGAYAPSNCVKSPGKSRLP